MYSYSTHSSPPGSTIRPPTATPTASTEIPGTSPFVPATMPALQTVPLRDPTTLVSRRLTDNQPNSDGSKEPTASPPLATNSTSSSSRRDRTRQTLGLAPTLCKTRTTTRCSTSLATSSASTSIFLNCHAVSMVPYTLFLCPKRDKVPLVPSMEPVSAIPRITDVVLMICAP